MRSLSSITDLTRTAVVAPQRLSLALAAARPGRAGIGKAERAGEKAAALTQLGNALSADADGDS